MEVRRQSESILGYLDSAKEVEDSVTVQGPEIAQTLDQRFQPRVEALIATGEVEDGRPVYRAILFSLRDELAASREELSAVEYQHIDLKGQITELAIERETLHEDLGDDYTFLRGSLEKRAVGRKVSAQAGLQGPTARKSSRLVRQVKVAVYKLSKPDLEIAEDRLAAFGFDIEGTVARLKAKAERLDEVLQQLRRLKRKLQVSQVAKDKAVERHRKTFVPVTRTLEGYYRLAGEDELADQIRPSVVQRGRRAVEVEDAPDAPPVTGPAEGASTAEPSPDAEVAAPSTETASPSSEDAASGVSPGGDPPASPAADAESSDTEASDR